MKKQKNQPLLKLMRQVLHQDEWSNGDTSKFARVLSKYTKKNISHQLVYSWLNGKGIASTLLGVAEELSRLNGGDMSAKELRPDLFKTTKDI
jgi:hypothetical protein